MGVISNLKRIRDIVGKHWSGSTISDIEDHRLLFKDYKTEVLTFTAEHKLTVRVNFIGFYGYVYVCDEHGNLIPGALVDSARMMDSAHTFNMASVYDGIKNEYLCVLILPAVADVGVTDVTKWYKTPPIFIE